MIGSAFDADQKKTEEILYHLRRSFSPGDKNYQAQFLYGRELCIADQYEDAKPIFAKLKEAKVSFRQKSEIKRHLMDDKGERKRLEGTVVYLRPSFGFIQAEAPKLRVYFDLDEVAVPPDELLVGLLVTFELGFNMSGPAATNVCLIDR
jgi:hypothetical protein